MSSNEQWNDRQRSDWSGQMDPGGRSGSTCASLVIVTRRLRLRPVQAGDAAATSRLMVRSVSDALLTWPAELSPAEAGRLIERSRETSASRRGLDLAIHRRVEGVAHELIGWLGMRVDPHAPGTAHIGYWLGEEFQSRGYMKEAVAAAIPELARWLSVGRVIACAHPDNFRSVKVLAGAGFDFTGERELVSPVRRRSEIVSCYERTLAWAPHHDN